MRTSAGQSLSTLTPAHSHALLPNEDDVHIVEELSTPVAAKDDHESPVPDGGARHIIALDASLCVALHGHAPLLLGDVELPEVLVLIHHRLATRATEHVERARLARHCHRGEAGGRDKSGEDDGVRGVGDVRHVGALHEVVHAGPDLGPHARPEGVAPHLGAQGRLLVHVAAVDIHRLAGDDGGVAEARRHALGGLELSPRVGLEAVGPEVAERLGGAAAVHVHHTVEHHGGVVVAGEGRRGVDGGLEVPLVVLERVLPEVAVLVGGALAAEHVHGVVVHHGGVGLAGGGRVGDADLGPHEAGGVDHRLLVGHLGLHRGVVLGHEDRVPVGGGARVRVGEHAATDEELVHGGVEVRDLGHDAVHHHGEALVVVVEGERVPAGGAVGHGRVPRVVVGVLVLGGAGVHAEAVLHGEHRLGVDRRVALVEVGGDPVLAAAEGVVHEGLHHERGHGGHVLLDRPADGVLGVHAQRLGAREGHVLRGVEGHHVALHRLHRRAREGRVLLKGEGVVVEDVVLLEVLKVLEDRGGGPGHGGLVAVVEPEAVRAVDLDPHGGGLGATAVGGARGLGPVGELLAVGGKEDHVGAVGVHLAAGDPRARGHGELEDVLLLHALDIDPAAVRVVAILRVEAGGELPGLREVRLVLAGAAEDVDVVVERDSRLLEADGGHGVLRLEGGGHAHARGRADSEGRGGDVVADHHGDGEVASHGVDDEHVVHAHLGRLGDGHVRVAGGDLDAEVLEVAEHLKAVAEGVLGMDLEGSLHAGLAHVHARAVSGGALGGDLGGVHLDGGGHDHVVLELEGEGGVARLLGGHHEEVGVEVGGAVALVLPVLHRVDGVGAVHGEAGDVALLLLLEGNHVGVLEGPEPGVVLRVVGGEDREVLVAAAVGGEDREDGGHTGDGLGDIPVVAGAVLRELGLKGGGEHVQVVVRAHDLGVVAGDADLGRGHLGAPAVAGGRGADGVDRERLGRVLAGVAEEARGGRDGAALLAEAAGLDHSLGGRGGALILLERAADAVVASEVRVQDLGDGVAGGARELGVLALGHEVAHEADDTVVVERGVLGAEAVVLVKAVVGNQRGLGLAHVHGADRVGGEIIGGADTGEDHHVVDVAGEVLADAQGLGGALLELGLLVVEGHRLDMVVIHVELDAGAVVGGGEVHPGRRGDLSRLARDAEVLRADIHADLELVRGGGGRG
mmetsp:Transcript_57991/g.184195  ORF Transcript_57991/g.184195 Transcript_57991/m.184195 type:complete len:1190 (-) Transcript_57991:5186-8755(-)